MTEIKVVDSIMGSGKTTFAINTIKNSPDKRYIYVTPYLGEVERVKNSILGENKMYEPTATSKRTKGKHLFHLVRAGKNVCTTHALLKSMDSTTKKEIEKHGYTLILDEVMDVVEGKLHINQDDIDVLLASDLCKKDGCVMSWNEEKLENQSQMASLKGTFTGDGVVVSDDNKPFDCLPISLFYHFSNVYILTYMFDSQIQKYYFDLLDVKYKKYQLIDGGLSIFDNYSDNQIKMAIKERITVYEGVMNDIGSNDTDLSLGWYDRADRRKLKQLSNNMLNWFRNINGGKGSDRLWTSFKKYQKDLKGSGFALAFAPNNIRATNEYRDRTVLAYTCNRFMRPDIVHLFESHGVEVDQDGYALSEMIQWIWRSGIREGKDISIYIPSKRMRTLLLEWLE